MIFYVIFMLKFILLFTSHLLLKFDLILFLIEELKFVHDLRFHVVILTI